MKMRKSLGNKRNELSNGNIAEIVELYGDLTKNGRSKLFDNEVWLSPDHRRAPAEAGVPGDAERIDASRRKRLPEARDLEEERQQGLQEIEEGQSPSRDCADAGRHGRA